MEAANARLAAFSARVKIATAAAIAAAAASGIAMVRSGLATVDAQAKLAQSLGTTVASIQVLERAGELAGVAMSGIEQATKDLTRRLSQAASGAGPAAEALGRLGLSASELLALPLDERVGRINQAIADFVPAAERAAVAGQLFGEEGSIAMARLDTATLRQATQDVRDFGVVVSEADADRIERANAAISRLGLIWRGLSNQLAAAAAPALEAVANAIAAVARTTGPLGIAIRGLFDNLGRLATYAATFAGIMAGRWVAGLVAAAVSVRGLATALVVLRGALIRTGIGALIVAAGETVYQFGGWSPAPAASARRCRCSATCIKSGSGSSSAAGRCAVAAVGLGEVGLRAGLSCSSLRQDIFIIREGRALFTDRQAAASHVELGFMVMVGFLPSIYPPLYNARRVTVDLECLFGEGPTGEPFFTTVPILRSSFSAATTPDSRTTCPQ